MLPLFLQDPTCTMKLFKQCQIPFPSPYPHHASPLRGGSAWYAIAKYYFLSL